jgi:hypothetical protein
LRIRIIVLLHTQTGQFSQPPLEQAAVPPGGLDMQPSMIVEPKRINTDDPVPAPVAIFLLMVHHILARAKKAITQPEFYGT